MVTKNIKLKNADGDYLFPYTENLPSASPTTKGAVFLENNPTINSNNAITSGGVKIALDLKLDKTETAAKALADAEGCIISDTYATKEELLQIEQLAYEAKNIAEGQTSATVIENYEELVTELNQVERETYKIGDNFYIQEQYVPDLWVCDIKDTCTIYTYTTDKDFIAKIKQDGIIQIGYFELSPLETEKVDLSGYVPTSRTINGKLLNQNINITAQDVGALATDGTASKAISDSNGNNIINTYATKSEIIIYEEM